MKKALFTLLTILAFTGMSVAQDVYSSGYYYNHDNNKKVAAVYRNNELLFSTGNDLYYNHESTDVLLLDSDVYWVDNCTDSDGEYYYSRVMKNNVVFLEIPIGTQSHISCLFTEGGDVYAGGNMDVNGHQKPMVWKNTAPTPYLTFDATNYYYGYLHDAMIVDGLVIACGYVYDNNINGHVGVIWQENNGEIYTLDGYVVPESMDYYNGSVYTATWDVDDNIGAVYQDDNVLYTLTTSGSITTISVDAGDVFAGVFENGGSIWKNGEKLYDTPHYNHTKCIVANSEGVYYATDGHINKNNHTLYLFELDDIPVIHSLFVDLKCQNDVRNLPYYEGFETEATDWACWGALDIDNQNNGYASYWDRVGERIITSPAGQYCARHRFNSTNQQDGVLVTPLLSIPEGGNVTMTFKTFEEYPSDYGYEGVWVVEGGHKVLGNEVWTQTEPLDEWKTVTIDLSAYQGKDVEIDFRYNGLNAHSWYIDDIMITSDFQPCPPVTAPYAEHFDTGLGDCMYVFETDHDGSCWEWHLGYQAALHPNGGGSNQGGALLTPSITLPTGKAYQLNFDYRALIPTKGESIAPVEFSVWMGVDGNGLGDLEDFNEIWRKIPVASINEFETVTYDLTPFSGHSVQFGFVYEGNGEYGWLLDNIAVVEKTGVDENGPSTGSGALVIYPNPANDCIRIEGFEADSEVQLFNVVGELVKTVNVDANSEIDITELASGLYMVRCGKASIRFVKE